MIRIGTSSAFALHVGTITEPSSSATIAQPAALMSVCLTTWSHLFSLALLKPVSNAPADQACENARPALTGSLWCCSASYLNYDGQSVDALGRQVLSGSTAASIIVGKWLPPACDISCHAWPVAPF